MKLCRRVALTLLRPGSVQSCNAETQTTALNFTLIPHPLSLPVNVCPLCIASHDDISLTDMTFTAYTRKLLTRSCSGRTCLAVLFLTRSRGICHGGGTVYTHTHTHTNTFAHPHPHPPTHTYEHISSVGCKSMLGTCTVCTIDKRVTF